MEKSVECALPLYLITGVARQVHSELIPKDVYMGDKYFHCCSMYTFFLYLLAFYFIFLINAKILDNFTQSSCLMYTL